MAGLLSSRGLSASGTWQSRDDGLDPFMDLASLAMPTDIRDALLWCEFILNKNGPYREALRKVIAYFNTDVEIDSPRGSEKRVGRDEQQKYLDFLNDTVGIKTVLDVVAMDFLGYGNSLTSLLVPFRRYLSCGRPGCGVERPLKRVFNDPKYGFRWSNCEFHAKCPDCGYEGAWKHIDRRAGEKGDLKVKRWSPHEIDILEDPYSKDRAYIWKIPDDYRRDIKQGHLFILERAPWEVIQAVKNNQNLMFDKDVIYHMLEEPMAGQNTRGWGFAKTLVNFSFAWYNQTVWQRNEAIAYDYIIPFRVLTPAARAGAGGEVNDPVLSINLGGFVSRVNQMLKARRRDPARWNVLPFPMEYQALGGDANQLVPKDLLELGMDTLLNAAGVPVQFYKGDLSATTAGPAMRLFEANWSHLVHHLNRFLQKLVDRISQAMGWEPVTARLQKARHADDLNRQMAMLQLMMGGQISKTTGLASVGTDFIVEERQKLEEERLSAEAAQEIQKEMEQAAMAQELAMPQPPQAGGAAAGGTPPGAGGAPPGAPAAGGMPADPAAQGGGPGAMGLPQGPGGAAQMHGAQLGLQPGVPLTPEEMDARANTVVDQLIGLPEGQQQSLLTKLKQQDVSFHAIVKSRLNDRKQEMKAQAEQIGLQQMGAPQGQPPMPPPQKMASLQPRGLRHFRNKLSAGDGSVLA